MGHERRGETPIVAFRVALPASLEDAVSGRLWERGTLGLELREAEGGALTILAYFDDAEGLERSLRGELELDAGVSLERVPVPEVDWVARFREGFVARRVGGFLIAPCWDVPGVEDGSVLVVDPGRAFGTGTHESTRLCLRALESLAVGAAARVLDVGAGSGDSRRSPRPGSAPGAWSRATSTPRPRRRRAGMPSSTASRSRSLQCDGGAAFRAGAFDAGAGEPDGTAPDRAQRGDPPPGGRRRRRSCSRASCSTRPRPSAKPTRRRDATLLVDGEWAAAVIRMKA